MPITLEKLFSGTRTIEFPFMGETVHVTYVPLRWTGEMQELAAKAASDSDSEREEIKALRERAEAIASEAKALDEGSDDAARLFAEASDAYESIATRELQLDTAEKALIREHLSVLMTDWDVLLADGTHHPHDVESLKKLPDVFLRIAYVALGSENQADPPKAPSSSDESDTEKASAPSPSGTSSSPRPGRSASRRSSSTNGPTEPAITPSGAAGR